MRGPVLGMFMGQQGGLRDREEGAREREEEAEVREEAGRKRMLTKSSLVNHCQIFGFHSKWDRKPLAVKNDMIHLTFYGGSHCPCGERTGGLGAGLANPGSRVASEPPLEKKVAWTGAGGWGR